MGYIFLWLMGIQCTDTQGHIFEDSVELAGGHTNQNLLAFNPKYRKNQVVIHAIKPEMFLAVIENFSKRFVDRT